MDSQLNLIEKELCLEALRLARELGRKRARLVLAESCTGGRAAAALVEIPGISDWFCGSAVTYRIDTKSRWLGVPRKSARRNDAVNEQVALAMARGALIRTPEAKIAGAITGHLHTGQLFVCAILRGKGPIYIQEFLVEPGSTRSEKPERVRRQVLASHALLYLVRSLLKTRRN